MTKVLQSRPATNTAGPSGGAQSNHAGDPGECATGSRAGQPLAAFRDKERIGPAVRAENVTLLGISPKSRARGVRDGHKARFAELRLANGENESGRAPR